MARQYDHADGIEGASAGGGGDAGAGHGGAGSGGSTMRSVPPPRVDPGGLGATDASPGVVALWELVEGLTVDALPSMGLEAGLRPAADVDLLLRGLGAVEYELARRMSAAEAAGALPLLGPGAVARARAWSSRWARRLARSGAFASRFPAIARPWAAGLITSEHVDAVARQGEALNDAEMAGVLEQLAGRWGTLTPEAVGRFLARVARMLHPPPDAEPAASERDAYAGRGLSFSILGDDVLLAGTLPRLEGEAVIAAVDAWAERLRTAADHVPAAARRADGLVALVNAAAAGGVLPNRGGLPVALTVTVDTTDAGDTVWTTGRGHHLRSGEQRFAACAADVTGVAVVRAPGCERPSPSADRGAAGRIAGLARTLLDTVQPLAVGRTQRHATPAQRKALAARDRGCVIPGCGVPAEACQAHHLVEWAEGGETAVDNMALVCWAHHRQIDLDMWDIEPAEPGCSIDRPQPGAPPGSRWPANHGAPWVITATPRSRWRL
jgi:hypothetical protein